MQDGWWLVCSESGQATAQCVVQLLFQGASRAALIHINPSSRSSSSSSSSRTAHPRSRGAAPAACGSAAPAGRGRRCTPCSAVGSFVLDTCSPQLEQRGTSKSTAGALVPKPCRLGCFPPITPITCGHHW